MTKKEKIKYEEGRKFSREIFHASIHLMEDGAQLKGFVEGLEGVSSFVRKKIEEEISKKIKRRKSKAK